MGGVSARARTIPIGGGSLARAVFAPSIALAGLLSLVAASRLIAALGPTTWLPLLAGVLLGILAADLVTGVVHWACDTWGSEETPWLGEALIRSFREHHRKPRAMLEHDWIEVNGVPATTASAAWILWLLWEPLRPNGSAAFAPAFVWGLVSFGALANQLHRWAHSRVPPRAVRCLQRAGVLLSPARHAGHHRAPHTTGYCIATGWSNRVLDGLGFWRGLERCIELASGARPRARTENGSGSREEA